MKRAVTVIGGGTGSFHVLSGLRRRPDLEIRSVVTMMDSGGDSGRLRDEFGLLPPGDLRRCLVALSGESDLLRDLFGFRFEEAPLEGRSFGNLFVLALTRTLGSEKAAIDALSRLLDVRGRVLPVTWDHPHLYAELADGTLLEGEANIGVPDVPSAAPIERVYLEPPARANPDALDAIASSDFVVLAPGDLYTSSIPNLLVDGIGDALRRTPARLVYILNLMTRYGETSGYPASRHVSELARYAGRVPDAVLANRGEIPAALTARYEAEAAHPVELDEDELARLGVRHVVRAPVMSGTSLVRHDPERTAEALEALFERLAGDGA
ncbi:MAG: gluconeogenesis factor YvcK family protein [Myxococcota bacterium]